MINDEQRRLATKNKLKKKNNNYDKNDKETDRAVAAQQNACIVYRKVGINFNRIRWMKPSLKKRRKVEITLAQMKSYYLSTDYSN